MQKLQNKAVAWAIVVILVLGSTWWGANRSLWDARYAAQKAYYGDRGSSDQGIRYEMQEIGEVASGVVEVAEKYTEPGNILVKEVSQLADKMEQGSYQIGESSGAVTDIRVSLRDLREYLDTLELSESDKTYLDKVMNTIDAHYQSIVNSDYNKDAEKFNRQLRKYPTKFFVDAFHISPLELFELEPDE